MVGCSHKWKGVDTNGRVLTQMEGCSPGLGQLINLIVNLYKLTVKLINLSNLTS